MLIINEIGFVLNLIINDKPAQLSALLITTFSIVLALIYSPLAALAIYCSYVSGFLACWCLVKYQSYVSVYFYVISNFFNAQTTSQSTIKHSCSICDDLSCKRHFQAKSVAPWRHLFVDKDLNSALEHFYNKILDNFILTWYGQITSDSDFLNELRYCLRYASATVINRFLELDHSRIISTKLLPCLVKHIDDYLYMQQIVKLKNARINDVIVEYLGKRLHIATANRRNELDYLRHLSAGLLPFILPASYLKCRNYSVLIREILAGWVFLPLMDVLADPNIINSLVILAVGAKMGKKAKNLDRQESSVEFLNNFVEPDKNLSSFAVDLNTVKGNTELLYAFMQFLKREEHVHLLQFCLDVDEFNMKLLTPDLTKKQLEELHSEAITLYNEYLSRDSLNFIGCPKEIINDFYSLIENGIYTIAKLRTSKPLYQAYEFTFNLLESVWLLAFFHSNEFYSYICGSKITATYNKSTVNRTALFNIGSPVKGRNKKYNEQSNQGTVSKISSGLGKIKGALKTSQPIEGAIFPLTNEPQSIENCSVETIIIPECNNIFRDLSAWRISILSYQTTNKVVSFCINVQRLDAVDDDSKRHWVVLRKDQDFYTLKAKLVEFHGENEICDSPLPSRRAGSPLEIRMAKYESFLKNLLQKPFLRGSDLLYIFLTAEEDFSLCLATAAANSQDLGNIYQSVAHKLRKEKGQNLDGFMQNFLQHCCKSKQNKLEWAEIGDEYDTDTFSVKSRVPPLPKTFRNCVFNDNFGVNYSVVKETFSGSFNPNGITECIFYLLKYVFKVPNFLLRFYAAICSIAKNAVESFSSVFIQRKLKSSLCPHNLAYLIRLLEDVVFNPYTPPTKEELEIRKMEAFRDLESIISPIFHKIVGNNNVSDGLKYLLEILQHPHYNKQLAYNLLDFILIEMYPVLGKASEL